MSKEHAYAYEAGYRDGSINYEIEHCPACKNVADLQEALADNAKLKKLAQRMWRLERFGCYGCRQECDAESCYANDCKEAIEIEQEMRELGVVVDDG